MALFFFPNSNAKDKTKLSIPQKLLGISLFHCKFFAKIAIRLHKMLANSHNATIFIIMFFTRSLLAYFLIKHQLKNAKIKKTNKNTICSLPQILGCIRKTPIYLSYHINQPIDKFITTHKLYFVRKTSESYPLKIPTNMYFLSF